MKTTSTLMLCIGLSFVVVPISRGSVVDITLNTNPPPLTAELITYLSDPDVVLTSPLVGFDAADIGNGLGNGINELIAFSFVFPPLMSVTSATLTLELTVADAGIATDEFLFSDNNSLRIPNEDNKYYGNDQLRALAMGGPQTVAFDLTNLGTNEGLLIFGNEDVSGLLIDGDFNVIYLDDAIIHSARLQIEGPAVPVPAVSGRGIVFMTLCLLVTSSIVLSRRFSKL